MTRQARYPFKTYLTLGILLISWGLSLTTALTRFEDTLVEDKRVLTEAESPYLFEHDVTVSPSGEIVIEPGVELRFNPEVGITVRGILTAAGTPSQKIRFVPARPVLAMQPNRTVRLVDGPTVNEGIIQILELGSWRSVCTNSQNWTQADMEVACREMGFTGGEWHHWYPHLNDTRQMMFQEPGCSGYEPRIESCQFHRRQMGSGVCDHHPNLGLRCLPFHHRENKHAHDHWRGLRFESAQFRKDLTQENTLYVSTSRSILRHVEVSGAGRGFYKGRANVTSAIETWGVPPVMEHILVENSAYNGINVTMPNSNVQISYANVTNNRGYGIFVNSTRGYVSIENSWVKGNMADGIKYNYHDQKPEFKLIDGVDIHDFCTYSTAYSQTYPFLMIAEQYAKSIVDRECAKRFYTKHGYLLTLHFVHLSSNIDEGASIEVRDGSDSNSRLIDVVQIKNYTRPESIVTTGNNIYILFRAKAEVRTEVFLEVTVGKNKAVDLNVTETEVADNSGRGIWLEHMRSGVHIHKSVVKHHNHVAGVNVNWGAGDVNITHSQIIDNYVDGVNITYGGGCKNVSWSTISNNVGKGFALYINETTINYPVRHETVIAYSNISLNYDIGVLVGNFCGPSIVNISGNHFVHGRYFGLEVLSCWRDSGLDGVPFGNMELFIGHNHFEHNQKVAVKLSPIVRAVGSIEHNDFLHNKDGCVYTDNEDDFRLEIQKVNLTIIENRFRHNSGTFVLKLGLSHYDFLSWQKLLMEFNWVQQNVIKEPWKGLNPRSQVAAPVVIASKNVVIRRNLIDNPESRYELGSHLIEPNSELDCRTNWLGHKDEKTVWERVFDRDDRYNLAKIKYVPYLLANNINTELVLERPEWEHQFIDPVTREVGGEVTGVEELREDGVYVVRRDINVRPNGRIKITPGVTLKFEHSIGMMVAGEIIAEGDRKGGRPVLSLLETVRDNVTDVPVRLVGGKNPREGRLQVNVNKQWGTVCNFGWTIESAALACQQMGWVLNPEDWNLQPIDIPDAGSSVPILMSNVRCGPLDTDLTACKLSEGTDMFLNSCTHADDVGLRCYDVSWAGLRLGMTAKRSKLFDIKIERAGLYDFRKYAFQPALQADFSRHVFEYLDVSDNDHDGLGILYSDIYFPDRVNFVQNSVFSRNKRHGISFRQLGLLIEDSKITDNYHSGIHHDPRLEKFEQRELAEWMSLIDEQTPGTIISIPESEQGTDPADPIILYEGQFRLVLSQTLNNSDITRRYHLRCERDEFVIGMQLVNPFLNYTSEELLIYDFREARIDPNIEIWNVSRDIASFPMISSSYAVTLDFTPGDHALGHMMLLLTPINCANLPGNCNTRAYHINPLHRSKIVPGSFSRLTIQRSTIARNGKGLSALHYNRYLGDDSQIYLKKANESIEVFDSEVSGNLGEAFYVFTPFRELNQVNISEITYMINRTRFLDNGRGIFQYSKDLRDSNNLYHWVLRENIFERNSGGGMDVSLPYVWQYNENYTHTVHIDSNNMRTNEEFGITVRGHFARVYIVNNTFFDNVCYQGLLALRGMEKESWIFANNIQGNQGLYMVEFEMDSHSEIMGFVAAYFTDNIVQKNAELDSSQPSRTISVKGVQKFNITNNLFGNPGMDYELLAGIKTARVSNYLNTEMNFWGTSNLDEIRKRIFDFDDWNSYALAHFVPYLLQSSFESSLSSIQEEAPEIDLDNLGGRLYESLTLYARPGRPYVIKSDLTVMPDVTLTIEPGAVLEFFPSVGMLVLGTLHAQGNIDRNIIMRPVQLSQIGDYRMGRERFQIGKNRRIKARGQRQLRVSEEEDFDVRLCVADKNGTVCPEGTNQGFVEIFNKTTMQWIPLCDQRFTERNAQVVCRQLGFSDLNVFVSFDQRIEYNAESLTRIIYWPEPYQCVGDEPRYAYCPLRMNGQIYGHDYRCNWKGKNFVFVHCGKVNLDPDFEYWGGIRFSVKEFEPELFHSRIHDAVTHSVNERHHSILEYVQIIGAGLLHGEKSPAVQTIMRSPLLASLNITHCAHDGINLISPSHTMNMLYNKIENNAGVGISAAILTGEVREAELSAFEPIEEIPIPYHNFGLVDICDPQKEIVIEERLLLYYKYDNNPVDCVKIFSSIYDVKPIGFRLLQYNFVNSSGEPWIPDHLTLYDGDLYNTTTKPIVQIKVDGVEKERLLYRTTRTNSMSVKFHATGAREQLGFVAEVVTLPITVVGLDRDIRHNMSFSVFENNQRGAIHYTSAGEINPIITIQRNQFLANCLSLYGNFSTCKSTVHMDIQNTQDVFFYNNFLSRNIGGLYIKSGSSGTATALRGLLHNNVFEENEKKVTLHMEGRQTSPYQQLTMFRNYFTRSNVPHEPVIKLDQIVCNATYNTIHNNRGKSIMEVTGFDNVRLPIYQSFTHNGFYNNYAYGLHCYNTTFGFCRWGSRATVVAGSAGQEYVDNVFYNRLNDYELMTLNRSIWDVWKTPINAKYNYWAYNETYAVAGRIKDLHDEDGLLEVDFTPFHMNNRSLLSGKCQPGWTLLGDTCFMYHGGPMTYPQAIEFCAKDNATLPTITNFHQYHVLAHYLELQQEDWRYYDMVWINDLDNDNCNVFVDGTVKSVSCTFMLPALCEMDEHVRLQPPTSVAELPKELVYAIVAIVVMILFIIIICFCWCNKTKKRRNERFVRKESIRMSKSSLGSRSLASMASTGFSDINYRRRFINNSKQGIVSPTGTNYTRQPPTAASFDSLADKRSLALNSTVEEDLRSYDVYEAQNNAVSHQPAGASGLVHSVSDLGGLGSHLSPGGNSSFAAMHDVHYSGGNGVAQPQSGYNVNAVVHSSSGYDLSSYDNAAYRPETRQSHMGPPGYSSRPSVFSAESGSQRRPDSVTEMKQDLKVSLQQQSSDDKSPSGTEPEEMNTTTSDTSSSDERNPPASRDYTDFQSMDRSLYETSTFRPNQAPAQQQPVSNPNANRALPQIPASSSHHQDQHRIPSVPGYAKPFAHSPQRPFEPPPSPPRPEARQRDVGDEEAKSRRPLLSEPMTFAAGSGRSRSVGQLLETNLDDDDDEDVNDGGDEDSDADLNRHRVHSRSLGESAFPKSESILLETDI